MPLTDICGRKWAHSTSIKPGDYVIADADFPCMSEGDVKMVRQAAKKKGLGGLFIDCLSGKHFLDSQLGSDGELVGLYPCIVTPVLTP